MARHFLTVFLLIVAVYCSQADRIVKRQADRDCHNCHYAFTPCAQIPYSSHADKCQVQFYVKCLLSPHIKSWAKYSNISPLSQWALSVGTDLPHLNDINYILNGGGVNPLSSKHKYRCFEILLGSDSCLECGTRHGSAAKALEYWSKFCWRRVAAEKKKAARGQQTALPCFRQTQVATNFWGGK